MLNKHLCCRIQSVAFTTRVYYASNCINCQLVLVAEAAARQRREHAGDRDGRPYKRGTLAAGCRPYKRGVHLPSFVGVAALGDPRDAQGGVPYRTNYGVL